MIAGWSRRSAALALLLLALTGPAVHAAAAGVLEPFPDRAEDRARHMRPTLPENMPFPGLLGSSPAIPTQVHPLYPNDGAVFPPAAAVTLSWRMPDRKAMPDSLRAVPKYFQVQVIGHIHPASRTVKYFPYNGKRPTYHGIFNIAASGRYTWQITAVMDDGSIIKSPARYFVVKQPYNYNHYFDVIYDVYPHYYYDSQDHRR